jgi:hypothetical protein
MASAHLRAKSLRFRLNPRYLAVIFATLFALFAWAAYSWAQPPAATTELVGTSSQGRPITAYRFGNGPNRIAFIGGIHQGDESNTVELINQAITYNNHHPNTIPADMTVIFIANANPDGFVLKQRHNARGVDLNRNWPTADWKTDTSDADGAVKGGGGKSPLSEPETNALWNYIKANGLIGTLWYHSRGGQVVDTMPTANGRRLSTQLARLMAASTGYTYLDVYPYNEVSGDASDFLNSKGIYSLTVELSDYNTVDWTQNLRGFSSAISFFSTRFVPETGKSISGRLLAFWSSNGGAKVMGNPTGNQQVVGGLVWQQFQKGTLTLDPNSGMVGWLEGARAPAPDALAIAQAPLPAQPTPMAIPGDTSGLATDKRSADLRSQVSKLQQQANDLQKEFSDLSTRLAIPATSIDQAGLPTQQIEPPSGDVAKAVKVVLGPNFTASIFVYEKGKLIRTIGAFSGKAGHLTPKGDFKIHYKNPNLQTNKWYEDEGTEFILKYFASFTGPSLDYSDDWGFHQMRIPVSGPDAGQMQAGPSHGCLAMSPTDAVWFYDWADEGTPVTIY